MRVEWFKEDQIQPHVRRFHCYQGNNTYVESKM